MSWVEAEEQGILGPGNDHSCLLYSSLFVAFKDFNSKIFNFYFYLKVFSV